MTIHLTFYLYAAWVFGLHLSVITTTDWTVEYLAALGTAIIADVLDRLGIARTRIGRFFLGT